MRAELEAGLVCSEEVSGVELVMEALLSKIDVRGKVG